MPSSYCPCLLPLSPPPLSPPSVPPSYIAASAWLHPRPVRPQSFLVLHGTRPAIVDLECFKYYTDPNDLPCRTYPSSRTSLSLLLGCLHDGSRFAFVSFVGGPLSWVSSFSSSVRFRRRLVVCRFFVYFLFDYSAAPGLLSGPFRLVEFSPPSI